MFDPTGRHDTRSFAQPSTPLIRLLVRILCAKYNNIWEVVHNMEWGFVFKNLREENVSIIREFYTSWHVGDPENLVSIRRRLIIFSLGALCKFLNNHDFPSVILYEFIGHPIYQDIRCTLSVINSNVAWMHKKKGRTHGTMPNVKFFEGRERCA